MINAILFGTVFGLFVGFFVARRSHRQDPIYGGGLAQGLHYLSASIVSAMPVTVIGVIITTHGAGSIWLRLGYALLTAMALSALMYTSAFLFATVERPAREAALQRKTQLGWTEEDARTSGL